MKTIELTIQDPWDEAISLIKHGGQCNSRTVLEAVLELLDWYGPDQPVIEAIRKDKHGDVHFTQDELEFLLPSGLQFINLKPRPIENPFEELKEIIGRQTDELHAQDKELDQLEQTYAQQFRDEGAKAERERILIGVLNLNVGTDFEDVYNIIQPDGEV